MQPSTDIDVERGTAPRLESGSRPLLYIAEDDDDLRETLAEMFARDGFAVRAAPDGSTMFDWLFRERRPSGRLPDVIVTDHRMPGYCALDILECLAEVRWTIPVIVVTAYGPELRGMARALGASAVFEKPFDPDALRLAAIHCVDSEFSRGLPKDLFIRAANTAGRRTSGRRTSGDA